MKKRCMCALLLSVLILVSGIGPEYDSGMLGTVAKAESTGNEESDYTYTVDAGYATITGYTGTDTEIVTPTTLGGYPVIEIGDAAFYDKPVSTIIVSEGIVSIGDDAFGNCKNLSTIAFPSTMVLLGYDRFYGCTSLCSINVADKNNYYFTIDGVLYKYVSEGITLYAYPAAKTDADFVVPIFVNSITTCAFSNAQNLERLYVPQTVRELQNHIFGYARKKLDLYLRHTTSPSLLSEQIFFNMPSGCHVLVKNQNVADAINTNIFCNTPDSSILVMGTDGNYPLIPTTSLTWNGANTKTSLLLHEGETYYLGGDYEQLPENSTDNITWKSSNTNIATVDSKTGKIQASGCENFSLKVGDCEITGTDESGHSITVALTVYQAITETELYCGSSNPTAYTVSLNSENNTKWISYITTPERAYN